MAKETNGTVRLLVQLGLILLAAAVVWGAVRQQVDDNTYEIVEIKSIELPKKLDKEVFTMYLEQQKRADEKTDKKLDNIVAKIDRVLEK